MEAAAAAAADRQEKSDVRCRQRDEQRKLLERLAGQPVMDDIELTHLDSDTWPLTKEEVQQASRRPAPTVCSTLAPQNLPGQWRGQHLEDTHKVDAIGFWKNWALTSKRSSDDLTESTEFLWGFYVLRLQRQFDVIGPGITKFFIADVPGVSDPHCPTRNLVAFFARQSNGSLVRIQPDGSQGTRLLYMDRPSPWYCGHVARHTPTLSGHELPGTRLAQEGPWRAIATTEGLRDSLFDTVSNVEARAALAGLQLPQGVVMDLSRGDKFPWVLWVHHQPDLMNVIKETQMYIWKFTATSFTYIQEGRERPRLIEAEAFRMHLDAGSRGTDFILVPLPNNKLIITEIEPLFDASACFLNNRPLQDALADSMEQLYESMRTSGTWPLDTCSWAAGTRRHLS